MTDKDRNRTAWTEDEVAMLKFLFVERKLQPKEVASVLGRTKKAVLQKAWTEGFKVRKGRSHITDEVATEVWLRLIEGQSASEIKEAVGISQPSYDRLRQDLLFIRREGTDANRVDRRELAKAWLEKLPSTRERWARFYQEQTGKSPTEVFPAKQEESLPANESNGAPTFDPRSAIVALAQKMLVQQRELELLKRRFNELVVALGGRIEEQQPAEGKE